MHAVWGQWAPVSDWEWGKVQGDTLVACGRPPSSVYGLTGWHDNILASSLPRWSMPRVSMQLLHISPMHANEPHKYLLSSMWTHNPLQWPTSDTQTHCVLRGSATQHALLYSHSISSHTMQGSHSLKEQGNSLPCKSALSAETAEVLPGPTDCQCSTLATWVQGPVIESREEHVS